MITEVRQMVRRYDDKTADMDAENSFRFQGFSRDAVIRRAGGADLPVRELPPFLRALLAMDGTVTKLLEAYFWEPVEVVTLQQEFARADRPYPRIRITPDDRLLIRRVRLSGADSGRDYATATSIVRTEFIPETFRQQLIDRRVGIGVLIRDSGMESYREVLEIGIEPQDGGDNPTAVEQSERVFRTYRVIIDGEPVILITERFPMDLYRPA